jgi:hypothetical protein
LHTFLLVGQRSNEIMTTFFSQNVSCANCHNSSQHDVLGSTSAFGSPDLDLRPAEMQRSTMEVWLQVCPRCRYIAPELSQQVGDLRVVATAEYRTTLDDQRFPELARRFLAHALLCVASDSAIAAQARLSAAWICDDAGQADLAKECRERAAECLSKLRPYEDSERGITQGAVFVDVLRRAGQLQRAAAECNALLALPQAEGVLRQVLEFENRLVGEGDTASHRVDECTR